MARIKGELATKREKLVFDIFVSNPAATVKDVNKQLKAEHGIKMNLSRIYQIFRGSKETPPRIPPPTHLKNGGAA